MAEKRPAEQDNRDDDEAAPEPEGVGPLPLEDVGPRAKLHKPDQPEINLQAKRTKANGMLDAHLKCGEMVLKELFDNGCTVVMDIDREGVSVAQYVVRLQKTLATDEWRLTEAHLPIGFSPDIVEKVSKVMSKDYLHYMHSALTAYHDRLLQIDRLKKTLPSHVNILSSANGTLLEIFVQIYNDQEESLKVLLNFKYDPFEIRPKLINVSKSGISEFDKIEIIKQQLNPFYLYTLEKGFKLAFQDERLDYFCPSDETLEKLKAKALKKQNNMSRRQQDGNIENGDTQEWHFDRQENADPSPIRTANFNRHSSSGTQSNDFCQPVESNHENYSHLPITNGYNEVGRFVPERMAVESNHENYSHLPITNGYNEVGRFVPERMATDSDNADTDSDNADTDSDNENNAGKQNLQYYTQLKSLNLGVSECIKLRVDKNPYCKLTPVIDDYIKTLKEIEKLKPAKH